MARKKVKDRTKLLSFPIRTRVNEPVYKRLENMAAQSNCRSVGEVARKILSQEKILVLHRDISLSGPMEELAGIRKELKAIGMNVNQITRRYHGSDLTTQKTFHALKAMEEYRKVELKVDRLLLIVSQIAEKWLQGY